MARLSWLTAALLTALAVSPSSSWLFGGGERVHVEIGQGRLAGTTKTSDGGKTYYSFEGVPYAQQPVGDLRFKKPQKAEPFAKGEVFEANKRVMCPQLQPIFELRNLGQEDCLVVNVYTPELPKEGSPSPKRAVMLWIHGGGYMFGSGFEYQPTFVMDHDVVYVSFNYRIGPLGFLTFGDDTIPANLGLWDQVAAMQWVKDNIVAFGGDPDKITIFGESAGSFSVYMHLATPQHSSGLYRAAIGQSGSAGSGWTLTDKHPSYYARSIGEQVGCDPDAKQADIADCLKKVPAMDLVGKNAAIFASLGRYPHAFQPVLDNATSSCAFFTKDPFDVVKEGSFNKVPLIFGTNEREGLFLRGEMDSHQELVRNMLDHWKEALAVVALDRSPDDIGSSDLEVLKRLEDDYFGGSSAAAGTEKKRRALEEVYEDAFFRAISVYNGRMFAEKSGKPVYEYLYSHRATYSLYTLLTTPLWKIIPLTLSRALLGVDLFAEPPGTCHADDALLMFTNTQVPFSPVHTEADRQANSNLWKLWTNFAKTLDPTPETSEVKWERLNLKDPKHLDISSELKLRGDSPEFQTRLRRWTDIWSKVPPVLHNSLESESWKDHTTHMNKKKEEGKKDEL